MLSKKLLIISIAGICLLLLIFFLIKKPYSESSGTKATSDDEKIVLAVSSVGFTAYEFEKNLTLFKNDYLQKNGHPPGSTDIERWIGSFIDRAYILADAYAKGYDTMTEVNKAVENMAHLIISQPGGLAEKTLQKSVTITDQELREGIKKASQKFHIEYLKFHDYDAALKYFKNNVFISNADFKEAVFRSLKEKGIIHGEEIISWPFARFDHYEDIIFSLREREISSILPLPDGAYVINMQRIDTANNRAMPDSLRSRLIDFLTIKKKEKIKTRYYDGISVKMQVRITTGTITRLEQKLQETGAVHEFDKHHFSDLLPLNAMIYNINGQTKFITVEKFMDYYNGLPMRQEVRTKNQLAANLQSMAVDDYLYTKARDSGITKETRFLLDRDNYKKNVIALRYELNELRKGITITEEEMLAKYNTNKNRFAQATDAVVTIFTFPDIASSMHLRFTLKSNPADSAWLKIVQYTRKQYKINYADKSLPDTVVSTVFNLKVNDVSRPVPWNGKYTVVVKESESGYRIKEPGEVKVQLARGIEEEKLSNNKKARIANLKKMYSIDNKIDYQKYTGIKQ